MDSEIIASAHKRNSRRARFPETHELLDRLDAIDMRLLQWLLRYPFQRAEDVAFATGSSIATVYRHLNVLHENGLVARVTPAALGTAKCRVYHLSNLGFHTLAVHKQADPAELARTWGTDEHGLLRLLPRVSSLMTLQDCINGLVVHAPEAFAYRGLRSEVRWHWIRDFAHRFSYREKVMRCTADAALLLRVKPTEQSGTSEQEQWYSLFVLLDVEIAGDIWLKQRLGRLLCYRESVERWPVYQHFPLVLVLVFTLRRMEHWQWCAMEAATMLHASPLLGTIACLPEKPYLSSYNPWRLAWKMLGTGGAFNLRQLLHPLPVEAIPPEIWNQHTTGILGLERTLTHASTSTTSTSSKRKRARIIVGNHMKRAKTVQIDHIYDTHDERKNLAMLGLNLGRRHLELLALLFSHPLLHVREIAALLDLEISSIERYLGMLRGSGCIKPLATMEGQRWQLSERGLRLLVATYHMSIQNIANQDENKEEVSLVQRGVDVLLRHIEHTAGIYGFFASLAQAATKEQAQGHDDRLLWWETGAACERRYRYHDHWHNLKPDAFAEYEVGERRARFWLEWDCGTMSSRDLAVKCKTYAQYVDSREWFKQEVDLPLLLIVTPNPGQERRMSRVVTDTLTDRCVLIIYTTTLTRLLEYGPLDPIWRPLLPKSRDTILLPRCKFYL